MTGLYDDGGLVDRLLDRIARQAVHIHVLQNEMHEDPTALVNELTRVRAERDEFEAQLHAYGRNCTPNVEELTEMLAAAQKALYEATGSAIPTQRKVAS